MGLNWLYLALFGFVFYRQNRHLTSVKSGDCCLFNLALFRNFNVFRKSLPARRDFGLRWQSGSVDTAFPRPPFVCPMLEGSVHAKRPFPIPVLNFSFTSPILPHPVGQRLSNLKNLRE